MTFEKDEESDQEEDDEEENFLEKDIDFIIFKNNINHEPDHILRYCFSNSSQPLYYSSYQKFSAGNLKCFYCGKKKAFEFQINCTIMNHIKEISGFDWGIIAVYSCHNSCFIKEQGFYEESVFL